MTSTMLLYIALFLCIGAIMALIGVVVAREKIKNIGLMLAFIGGGLFLYDIMALAF